MMLSFEEEIRSQTHGKQHEGVRTTGHLQAKDRGQRTEDKEFSEKDKSC